MPARYQTLSGLAIHVAGVVTGIAAANPGAVVVERSVLSRSW